MKGKDITVIKPYGDALGDGAVQLSFTLPWVGGAAAEKAAQMLAAKMGIDDPFVTFSHDIGSNMTFIVLYGKTRHSVNIADIDVAPEASERVPDMKTIDKLIEEHIGSTIVVIGACIESDAHTVGIDAIMNMKGYAGDYGLERYKNFNAVNLGAQISSEEVVKKIIEEKADVVLISQVVTQKNVHIKNLTRLVDLLEAEHIRDKVILIVGGPRITRELAKELGFDIGFGKETLPSHVAYYIYKHMLQKKEQN